MTINEAIQEGLQHHEAGRLRDAEHFYRSILAQYPDHPDATHLLGMIALRTGHMDQAEQMVRRATELNPSHAQYWGNLGLILIERKRLDEAVEVLVRAVQLDPSFAQAHSNLGTALKDQERFAESIAAFERAIALSPGLAGTYSNLAASLSKVGRHQEAVTIAKRAVEINPDLLHAQYNLGTVLYEAGRFEESITAYSKALSIKSDHVLARNNLGNALRRLNRLEEAIAAYSEAIAYDTVYADAHWNLALSALMVGDFDTGWFEYEWRTSSTTLNRPQFFLQPQWRGETLEGKTVLLHTEQGLGDSIQFVRYAPMVAARGGNVILQCQPELVRLFKSVPGVSQVISRDETPPAFDVQSPLMSLPLAFSTTLETIPKDIPYLSATEQSQEIWRRRISDDPAKLKIGLVWAGRSTHLYDHERSIRLEQLLPLSTVPGAQFYSLQKGAAVEELAAVQDKWKIIDNAAEFHDFADTAGLVSQMDLVIAVDTSVAHLAGAMGRPAWVLLHFAPDWRWMLDRGDSPWYPTTNLYRQTTDGDWSEVIDRVRKALQQRVQSAD